jgi:hypothetical protein
MAGIMVVLVGTEGVLLGYWALALCDLGPTLFYALFNACEKEERFLTELEHSLGCVSDDDIEGFEYCKKYTPMELKLKTLINI